LNAPGAEKQPEPAFLDFKNRWMDSPQPVLTGSAENEARAYTGDYLLRLSVNPETLRLESAFVGTDLIRYRTMGTGWLAVVSPPADRELQDWQRGLMSLPGVLTLEREQRRWVLQSAPNDPSFSRQWSHRADASDTQPAWALVSPEQQSSVVIAVLDTGLDVSHPEFAGRVVGPYNSTTASPTIDVTDGNGHGTHVTGIAAAQGNNAQGIAGVAWGARIKPVKVFGDEGTTTDSIVMFGFLNALEWEPQPDDGSRVRVINMSLGSDTPAVTGIWLELAQMARSRGIIVVAASGNSAMPFVGAPANTPGIFAVGSSNYHAGWETVSSFSNGGDALDVVAPGEDILSTVLGGGYGFSSGTSMASPYVAGVAALMAARYDRQNLLLNASFVDAMERRLRLAVNDMDAPGRDPLAGHGRLNAARALAPATLAADP
jgi:subtilisin family serine protease